MPEALLKAYNMLNVEYQKNAEQFIYFLVEQQKKEQIYDYHNDLNDEQDFSELVDSFIGCTHAWDGIDVMQYQHQLRQEYRDNG